MNNLQRKQAPGRQAGFAGRALSVGLALILAGLSVPAGTVAQQPATLVGQVVDATTGGPISEVQVYLVGASIGSLTRSDGRFIITNVPAGAHEVRAERIGYQTSTQQVTTAAGETVTLEFSLSTSALGLDEIVVTGTAGAARRREIGNTISQVDVADLPHRPTTVGDALASAAPGITLLPGSGELGNASSIRLRGINTVAMRNDPIIYIDGVRMMNTAGNFGNSPDYSGRAAGVVPSALDQINPNDIERIEVIKGSAATTLYGTEASAGVIQIFTKRGSQGAPVWTVETQQKVAWVPKFSVDPEPYARLDHWLSNGHNQDYQASVRGGAQSLQYFVSGGHQRALGTLPSDSLTQWNVRGNFTFSPTEDLQFQWNTSYSNRWQKNTPTSSNAQTIILNTWRAEVNYVGSTDPEVVGRLLDWQFDQDMERFTTGGTVTYSPIANLTNRLTVGYDLTLHEIRNIRPFGFILFPSGGIFIQNLRVGLLNFDYVGTYSFDLGEELSSSFSWGGQAVGEDSRTFGEWGTDFPGAEYPTVNSAAFTLGFEERDRIWNAGFFAQNMFDFRDRYFLTVGARVDGNSAFGEGFGLQVYPKASFSWVMSDEDFWGDEWGTLKLRAAYGQSGRAPGVFDAVRTWESEGLQGDPAFVPRNVGNPDLGPEVTGEFETGFDMTWFEDRLTSTVTYYHQTTRDALFNVAQVPSQGFGGNQRLNLGKTQNKGWEVQIEGSPIRTRDWGWDLGLNVTTNQSKVLEMGGVAPFTVGGGGMQGSIGPWVMEGQPIGMWIDRVVSNPDEIADPTYEDNVLIGPSQPTLTIGANTTVHLPAGIAVSARGEYRTGHHYQEDYFSVARGVRTPLCYPYYTNPEGIVSQDPLVTSLELKSDTPALWRARCTPSLINGAYWWDMTYFRLRNITATIPVDFMFPDRITGAVVTMSLDNAWLWRKDLPFGDPEAGGNVRRDADATPTDGVGIGTHRLPIPRSFTMGIRLTF